MAAPSIRGPALRLLALAPALFLAARMGQAAPRAGVMPRQPTTVVLVHGFTDTGAIFDPLVAVLEKQGCRCFAPTLRPNTFTFGVHDLTLKLTAEIDRRFGPSQPFVLVAQSMGGLVARDYVQTLGHGPRVQAFFEIVTANRGTVWANFSPGGGVRDFAIGSSFLRRLNADLSVWRGIPVQAYWTPFDLVVVPATNSRCAFGRTTRVLAPFHQSLVKNRAVMADIAAKIAALPVRPFANGQNGR